MPPNFSEFLRGSLHGSLPVPEQKSDMDFPAAAINEKCLLRSSNLSLLQDHQNVCRSASEDDLTHLPVCGLINPQIQQSTLI